VVRFRPHHPLLSPFHFGSDRPHVALGDWIAAAEDAGKVEELFLDVGGQVQEVHDLRDTGAGDVPEVRQLGLVADRPRTEQAVELDRQGHQWMSVVVFIAISFLESR